MGTKRLEGGEGVSSKDIWGEDIPPPPKEETHQRDFHHIGLNLKAQIPKQRNPTVQQGAGDN